MSDKPKKMVARLSDKYYVTENKKYLLARFELLEQNNTLNFLAGQYLSLKINELGERRSYSIASTPDVDHAVSVVVEIIPGGKGSEYLQNLMIGAEVEMIAPLGQFYTSEKNDKNLLLVATGSGIVPVSSIINDELVNKKNTNQIRLHWGMRSEPDLFWLDNFARLAEAHSNFVFDIVLSSPNDNWQMCRGHVQDCLKRDMSQVDFGQWSSYVCGNPKMVDEVARLLQDLGADTSSIHYERYA